MSTRSNNEENSGVWHATDHPSSLLPSTSHMLDGLRRRKTTKTKTIEDENDEPELENQKRPETENGKVCGTQKSQNKFSSTYLACQRYRKRTLFISGILGDI